MSCIEPFDIVLSNYGSRQEIEAGSIHRFILAAGSQYSAGQYRRLLWCRLLNPFFKIGRSNRAHPKIPPSTAAVFPPQGGSQPLRFTSASQRRERPAASLFHGS
jgi:hypothetical protein